MNWANKIVNFKSRGRGCFVAVGLGRIAKRRMHTLADWRAATIDGLRAYADAETDEAAKRWLTAACMVERAHVTEPLLAAIENNAGAALILMSDASEACSRFARAHDLWTRSHSWIGIVEPELVSSSAFHIRLAMHHHDKFVSARRRRYFDLCEAGRAIVALNSALAASRRSDGGDTRNADDDMIAPLVSAFGAHSVEVRMLLGTADERNAAYREKAERLAEWPVRSYLEGGQYLAGVDLAAHMSVVLPLSLSVGDTANESGSGDDD